MVNESVEIGEFLKTLRGKMSLREAAEKSGLSHSYINSLEKGEHPKTKAPIKPSADVLMSLSKAYKVDYELLMQKAGYLPSADPDSNKRSELIFESKTSYGLSDDRKRKYIEMYDKLPKEQQKILDQLAEVMLREMETKGKDH